MDQAARGKKALEDSKYEEAIDAYTAALKFSPTSPDYLIQRATAYQRAKNYTHALADANNAVLNAQKRGKKELIVEAQFRRGCAYYMLERYGDAGFVFSVVKRMNEKHKSVIMWENKVTLALKKLGEDDSKRKCTVKETPELEDMPTPGTDDSTPFSNGGSAAPTSSTLPPAALPQTKADNIRHEWYQNSENVYFTLLAKGVPKDKIQIDIHQRSLNISFPLASGSSYDLSLDPLFDAVNPDKCIPRVLPTKIEVVLAKATPGVKWSALESDQPISNASSDQRATADSSGEEAVKRAVFSAARPTAPVYPTSSKSGPKDWDKITRNLRTNDGSNEGDEKVGSMDDEDDYEGGDEANHFFRKLFKNASPETQRAMMKSYTESNGTALSTNWDEVSKGPVETLPPDGMEAKRW